MPKFENLREIVEFPIVGNAHHDSALMAGIHEFVVAESWLVHDRAAALRHLQVKVMGCPLSDEDKAMSDAEMVREYLHGDEEEEEVEPEDAGDRFDTIAEREDFYK